MSGEEKTEGKLRKKLRVWWKDTKWAIEGIGTVMSRPAYIVIAVLVFLLFAYIFALFQDGTSTWSLLWSGIGITDKLGLLGDVWDRVARNFIDPWGLVLIVLAAFQGLNISLIVYSIRKRVSRENTMSGVEAGGAGMAISLIILGCPTCGTSILVPFLTMILGSGAVAVVGVLGWVLTVVALVLLVFAARKLGYGAYLETNGICVNKKRRKKSVAKN